MIKSCSICKKDFEKGKFCSQVCYGISKLGKPTWNKGKKLTSEHRANLAKSHFGIKMPPRTEEHRKNMALARMGEKSHLWKGGVSKLNKKIRAGLEFRLWRKEVFERDNYTCQMCNQRGGEIHPDHIKPFALYPELRFELSNGRTLCADCHRKTPTFGRRFDLIKLTKICN